MKFGRHYIRLQIALFALVAVGPGRVSGFVSNIDANGHVRHWELAGGNPLVSTNCLNPTTRSVRFYLAGDAYSATNKTAELNAIRAAFGQWQSIPGTTLRFEDAGLAGPGMDVNTSDNTNVIFWAKSSTLVNGGFDDISGKLAVTYPRLLDNNVLAEADIVLNGAQVKWFTDLAATNSLDQFVESTALHEIGHFIGLEHSPLGGATMFGRSTKGIGSQFGLSTDELAAARTLYPDLFIDSIPYGDVQGILSLSGIPIFGGVIILENSDGNAIVGTVSRSDGSFAVGQVSPGSYQLRATPLDPPSNNSLTRLVTGADISPAFSVNGPYFAASSSQPVNVIAGATARMDFNLNGAAPAFHISRIMTPSTQLQPVNVVNAPVPVTPGESSFYIGIASPDLPLSNATLRVTGTGIVTGPPRFTADPFGSNPPLNLIRIPVSISIDAVPGLRSFVLQQGTNIAYANGFLDVLPLEPDYNFDGLNDSFQRAYFPLFTSPAAAPYADPDNDGLSNTEEFWAGTNPVDPNSALRIQSVSISASGALIRWQSRPGKNYRILRRASLDAESWQTIGETTGGNSGSCDFLDALFGGPRFYRIQLVL